MNLTRSLLLIFAVAICAASARADGAKALTGEAKEIADMVQTSQVTGLCKGDRDAYMSIWADDAKLISGRREEPGKYDFTITRAAMETKPQDSRWQWRSMRYENTRVTVSGDKAEMRCRTFLSERYWISEADEVFLLRKTDDGWKVYENRCWPIALYTWFTKTKYMPATWKKLDEKADRLKKQGTSVALVKALGDAHRIKEAYDAAKALTEKESENVEAWVYRGYAAVSLGKHEEGIAAFQKALELDEDAPVPDYAREDDSM
jgi:tetratricopeptide (TPR) repeat protein